MISLILQCTIGFILVYRVYKYMYTKPANSPPGPPRLPYIGTYLMLMLINYRHIHRAINLLCDYYKTNVLGLMFSSTLVVIANDNAGARAVLNQRELDGKPPLLLAQLRDPDLKVRGLFFTQGKLWHEQRRFMLRYLRDYGFGRRFEELELDTRDELKAFVEMIKNGPEYPHEKKCMKKGMVLAPVALALPFGNMLLKVLLNDRLPREEQHILYNMVTPGLTFVQKACSFGKLFSHSPIIAKIFPKWSGYNELRSTQMDFLAIIEKLVKRQMATHTKDHERNFIDMYFNEVNNAIDNDNQNSSFTYEQMLSNVVDFMTPALTTNSTVIMKLFQIFCKYPEVQRRVQQEIDDVVGQGCLPRLDHRPDLPYTEATLREILRYDTILPNGVVHLAMEETTLMGYDIPKGSIVFASLEAANRDPVIWDAPETFRPERFLDDQGKFSVKLDNSMPFGTGKRLCAGETFARNSMFLLLTAISQNFTVRAPDGQSIPDFGDSTTGLIMSSPNTWFQLDSR